MTYPGIASLVQTYLRLEAAFLVLFTLAFFLPRRAQVVLHLYLVGQCGLVLTILALHPQFDFVILLFLLLSYQVLLFFGGRTRLVWSTMLVVLTGGSLAYHLGLLRGLALAMTTMAAEIVTAAMVTVIEETEVARADSQRLLDQLQESNTEIRLRSSQIEEARRPAGAWAGGPGRYTIMLARSSLVSR